MVCFNQKINPTTIVLNCWVSTYWTWFEHKRECEKVWWVTPFLIRIGIVKVTFNHTVPNVLSRHFNLVFVTTFNHTIPNAHTRKFNLVEKLPVFLMLTGLNFAQKSIGLLRGLHFQWLLSWSLAHVIVQLSHGLHFSNKESM